MNGGRFGEMDGHEDEKILNKMTPHDLDNDSVNPTSPLLGGGGGGGDDRYSDSDLTESERNDVKISSQFGLCFFFMRRKRFTIHQFHLYTMIYCVLINHIIIFEIKCEDDDDDDDEADEGTKQMINQLKCLVGLGDIPKDAQWLKLSFHDFDRGVVEERVRMWMR